MIDWIKAVVPWRHSEKIHNGQVLSIDIDGTIEWTTSKRLSVRGSYESTINILTDISSINPETGEFEFVIIDGNPVKWFQGHNLWGSDDLVGLVSETVSRLSDLLNFPISEDDFKLITDGVFYVKRIDSTAMLELNTHSNVEAFLYSLERTGHMRYKGQGIRTKGTIYFGKHSRRESLKFYNKATELQAKGHKLPPGLAELPELTKWATGKLRVEHTLRNMELKDRGLALAGIWDENKPLEVLLNSISALNMSENHTLTTKQIESLPARLRPVYQLWIDGHDMVNMYSKTTFYRYRKQLLENAGIDIAVKQGNRKEPAPNVIQFKRVLVPELVAGPPEWAKGTPLYFEPRANVKRA